MKFERFLALDSHLNDVVEYNPDIFQSYSISGGKGEDEISGGSGSDVLDGGEDQDVIRPGLNGADVDTGDRIILNERDGDMVVGTAAELDQDTIVNPAGNRVEIQSDNGASLGLQAEHFKVESPTSGKAEFKVDINKNGRFDNAADILLHLETPNPVSVGNITESGAGFSNQGVPSTVFEFTTALGTTIYQPFNFDLSSGGQAQFGQMNGGGITDAIGDTVYTADSKFYPEIRNLTQTLDGRFFSVLEVDAGENVAVGIPPFYSASDREVVLAEYDALTGKFKNVTKLDPAFAVNDTDSVNALVSLSNNEFLAFGEFSSNPSRGLTGGKDFIFKVRTDGTTEFLSNLASDGAGTRIVSADISKEGQIFAWQDYTLINGGGNLLQVNKDTGAISIAIAYVNSGDYEISSISFDESGTLIALGRDENGKGSMFVINPVAGAISKAFDIAGDLPTSFEATGTYEPIAIAQLGSSQDDQLAGNEQDNRIDGGPGDDEILGYGGRDRMTGGSGADNFAGIAADLNGDVITDFTVMDRLTFLGSTFLKSDVFLSFGSLILDIDTDQDDTIDTTVKLEGDFDADQKIDVAQDDNGNTVLRLVVNNDAPITVDDTAVTEEDVSVTLDVLANDSDGDGEPLFLVDGSDSNGGIVSVLNNELVIRPALDFSGNTVVTYQVSDGTETVTGKVNITVNAVNDAPIAVADAATLLSAQEANIDVLANDTDAENDALTIESVTQATHGAVSINTDGTLTYSPNSGFVGNDSFTYTINDGNGGTASGIVFVDVTASNVNTAPIAQNDIFTGQEDAEITGNLLADNGNGADSDPDGDMLTITAETLTTVNGGTVILEENGIFTYTPKQGFSGQDSFEYTVMDGNGGADLGIVALIVTPVNHAPVAVDDAFAGYEDTLITGNVLTESGVDTDEDGDTLEVVVTAFTTVNGGKVDLKENGDFIYTPAENFSGTDSFGYEIKDGKGGADAATVNLSIAAIDDAPVLSVAGANATEDASLVITDAMLSMTDIDTPSSARSFIVQKLPSHGGIYLKDVLLSVSAAFSERDVTDGKITYVSDPNYNGTDSFEIAVSDGTSVTPAESFLIEISAVNDAPTLSDDIAETDQNTSVILDVLRNDMDIDSDSLEIESVMQAANGKVAINPDGSVTYTPNMGYSGIDHFTYSVRDDLGASAEAHVSVTVNAPIDNVIMGTEKFDFLWGTYDADTIYGLGGTDYILANDGIDLIYAGKGFDYVFAGSGADTVYGEGGGDFISGDKGNDTLFGGAGSDYMSGGAGSDLLHGGSGKNTLFGGSGADTFLFDEETLHDGAKDRIMDFNPHHGDKIDVSPLLGNYDETKDQIEDFLALHIMGRKSTLYVDIDGYGDNFEAIADIQGGRHFDLDVLIEDGSIILP